VDMADEDSVVSHAAERLTPPKLGFSLLLRFLRRPTVGFICMNAGRADATCAF
jgi:hypothetical protein